MAVMISQNAMDYIFPFLVEEEIVITLNSLNVDLTKAGVYTKFQYKELGIKCCYNSIYGCFVETPWHADLKKIRLSKVANLDFVLTELSNQLDIKILVYSFSGSDIANHIEVRGYSKGEINIYSYDDDFKYDDYDICISEIICYCSKNEVITRNKRAKDRILKAIYEDLTYAPTLERLTYFDVVVGLIYTKQIKIVHHPDHIKKTNYGLFRRLMEFKADVFEATTTRPVYRNIEVKCHCFYLIYDECASAVILYDVNTNKTYTYKSQPKVTKLFIKQILHVATQLSIVVYTYKIELNSNCFISDMGGLKSIQHDEYHNITKCVSHEQLGKTITFKSLDGYIPDSDSLLESVKKYMDKLINMIKHTPFNIHGVDLDTVMTRCINYETCLGGVRALTGNMREFVQMSIIDFKKKINDGNSCSLNCEMYRLTYNNIMDVAIEKSPGFPKGEPTIITQSIFKLKAYDWYVCRFKVIKRPAGAFIYDDLIYDDIVICNPVDYKILVDQGAKLKYMDGYYWGYGFNRVIRGINRVTRGKPDLDLNALYKELTKRAVETELSILTTTDDHMRRLRGRDIINTYDVKCIRDDPMDSNIYAICKHTEIYSYANYCQCGGIIFSHVMQIMYEIIRKYTVYYFELDTIIVPRSSYIQMMNEGMIGDRAGQFKVNIPWNDNHDIVECTPIDSYEDIYIDKAIFSVGETYGLSIVDKKRNLRNYINHYGDVSKTEFYETIDKDINTFTKEFIDRYNKTQCE